jgi:hypothetical protein
MIEAMALIIVNPNARLQRVYGPALSRTKILFKMARTESFARYKEAKHRIRLEKVNF